jgi:Zn ribbon nucleic-acid-binding protein
MHSNNKTSVKKNVMENPYLLGIYPNGKPSVYDIVQRAKKFGCAPFLVPGKRMIMEFTCPACGDGHMIKFIRKPDLRHKIHVCVKCGYRYMSPGWVEVNGTFKNF